SSEGKEVPEMLRVAVSTKTSEKEKKQAEEEFKKISLSYETILSLINLRKLTQSKETATGSAIDFGEEGPSTSPTSEPPFSFGKGKGEEKVVETGNNGSAGGSGERAEETKEGDGDTDETIKNELINMNPQEQIKKLIDNLLTLKVEGNQVINEIEFFTRFKHLSKSKLNNKRAVIAA
ncbi:687_t:CDS:2, partial [Ambispora leptoticha]